jgi:hypothetical protein
MEDKRSVYRLLVRKPEEMRLLRRPRRRGEDNIKMDLGEIGWSGVSWIDLTQDKDWRKVLINNTVINLWVP